MFLSYASEDAGAAQRICDALRAAGLEVWFDQSELRGGDIWDQKIRREIRDCELFIPVISANTTSRREGYFRLEWDLADQRTHMMARDRAFIVPLCLDATSEAGADVPESFHRAQWTRLPAGSSMAELADRLSALLARDPSAARQSQSRPAASSQLARSGTDLPLQVRQKTIAVLPFQDLSEKKDQEYFADGIAEEILNLMSRVPALRVIARTSSFRFRGKSDDLGSIATQLGAGFVVEGSVRQSGSRVRVSARLIDTTDGVQRWSNSYERDISDVLTVQEEIAVNLVSALQVEVAPDVLTISVSLPPLRRLTTRFGVECTCSIVMIELVFSRQSATSGEPWNWTPHSYNPRWGSPLYSTYSRNGRFFHHLRVLKKRELPSTSHFNSTPGNPLRMLGSRTSMRTTTGIERQPRERLIPRCSLRRTMHLHLRWRQKSVWS